MSTDQHTAIKYVWATAEQLDDVWRVQQQMSATWPHPKSFYEESISLGRVLLARDGDHPAAYALYQVLWGNTPFLALLMVAPAYQRQGIGKTLIKLLEQRLIDLGFKSYVASTETINPHTKSFFVDLGFEHIGELNMHHGGEIFYLKKFATAP